MASVLAQQVPSLERYSIDEAFASLEGVSGDLSRLGLHLRERLRQWLGLPCCVGIGSSKTLAKLANFVAKSAERKPGSYPSEFAGVCDLSALSQSG